MKIVQLLLKVLVGLGQKVSLARFTVGRVANALSCNVKGHGFTLSDISEINFLESIVSGTQT